MTEKKEMFVTRRDDGRYNVLRPNAERASAVTETQREAIDRALIGQRRLIRMLLSTYSECAAIHLVQTNSVTNEGLMHHKTENSQ